MDISNNKRTQKEEIERARLRFFADGGRVRQIKAEEESPIQDVKPRKQRLKMFA